MSGPGYAKGTTVDVSKSRAEIDHVLVKNGVSSVGILNDSDKAVAVVAFTIRGAKFRLEIPMPLMAEVEKVPRPRQWSYWDETRRSAWKRSELS